MVEEAINFIQKDSPRIWEIARGGGQHGPAGSRRCRLSWKWAALSGGIRHGSVGSLLHMGASQN